MFVSIAFAEETYLYSDNKDKNFISAAEFFKRGKLNGYSQLKNADLNIQQKLIYKDLKGFIRSKVNERYFILLSNVYLNQNENVSPNRQIYLYSSVVDNEERFKYKFIILDTETKEPLAEGKGHKF